MASWGAARWTAPAGLGAPRGRNLGGSSTRAALFYDLVQSLADAAADAEGRPRRPVPRLGSDLALPDQLRVMVVDLLAAGAPDATLEAAAAAIETLSRDLG